MTFIPGGRSQIPRVFSNGEVAVAWRSSRGNDGDCGDAGVIFEREMRGKEVRSESFDI